MNFETWCTCENPTYLWFRVEIPADKFRSAWSLGWSRCTVGVASSPDACLFCVERNDTPAPSVREGLACLSRETTQTEVCQSVVDVERCEKTYWMFEVCWTSTYTWGFIEKPFRYGSLTRTGIWMLRTTWFGAHGSKTVLFSLERNNAITTAPRKRGAFLSERDSAKNLICQSYRKMRREYSLAWLPFVDAGRYAYLGVVIKVPFRNGSFAWSDNWLKATTTGRSSGDANGCDDEGKKSRSCWQHFLCGVSWEEAKHEVLSYGGLDKQGTVPRCTLNIE